MPQIRVNQQVLTPNGVGFVAQVTDEGCKVRFRSGNAEWFQPYYLNPVSVGVMRSTNVLDT